MQSRLKKLLTRLLGLLLTLTIGVTVMLIWAAPRLRSVSSPEATKVSESSKSEQVAVPDGWKELDIKNRVTIQLPGDMKPSELIGDSFAHREAYSNRSIEITIAYGELRPPPRPNQKRVPVDRCETSKSHREEPTYQESVVEIDGRKAKLKIDRAYKPKFIIANVCFLNPPDQSEQLIVLAYCKDEPALVTAQQIFNSIRFKE